MRFSGNNRKCIFLVEDDPAIAGLLRRLLEKQGMEVKLFGDGSQCFESLHRQRCDLLITDAKVPGMDGVELLERVKTVAPWLPVLIMTGYADVAMARKAFRMGAYDLLAKPLDRDMFLAAVAEGLRLSPGGMPPLSQISLTRAEREVLQLLLDGKSTSEIARIRSRSKRTVDDQRRSLLDKLEVNDLANLVKRVAIVRFVELPEKK